MEGKELIVNNQWFGNRKFGKSAKLNGVNLFRNTDVLTTRITKSSITNDFYALWNS